MTLEAFLESIEGRAYRMAYAACGHREDALDMVQDAMFKFVDKYAKRPSDEWRPLFYRILHNRITDSHRRRSVRDRWNGFIGKPPSLDDGNEVDPFQTAPDVDAPTPEHSAKVGDAFEALQAAVQKLPERQRQVFLLRGWEELSVKETAFALKCSEGSVKTHFSRAVNTLREQLGGSLAMKNEQEFLDDVRSVLDDSVDGLDGATRSALTRARHAALDRRAQPGRERRWWLRWGAVPAAGLAVAAVLMAVFLRVNGTNPPESLMVDVEVLSSGEPVEFYEDLDFYQWYGEVEDEKGGTDTLSMRTVVLASNDDGAGERTDGAAQPGVAGIYRNVRG